MKISAEISYPGATPEQAYGLSRDPEFRAAVCEATHALDYDVRVDEHDDETASVVVTRTMPAEVPDFLKKMVGETIGVVQTEEWGKPDGDGQRTADVVVSISGQPAKMTGTAAIVRTDEGAAMRIEGDLKVAIPIFGKKVEPEIAKGIYAAIKQEQRTGTSWLS
ncbi:MAG TPA: DUF2505 domain-containing protein [Nocardioidaceae bacterium]|jgi:hypothetical protein